MKKKLLLVACMAVMLVCLFAISVSAECTEHTDSWTLSFGHDSLFDSFEATNICKECNLVLYEETVAPIITSFGYSYYNGSFTQGFRVNASSVKKYEEYSGKSLEYGIVAAASEIAGTAPVTVNAEAANENAIVYGLDGTEHFNIKITGISEENADCKIIACTYAIMDGQVLYADNDLIDTAVAGISYNEVVKLVDKGTIPTGLYSERVLSAEEMGITNGGYWHSNGSTYSSVVTNNVNSPKHSATRMFTRDELPSGSYIVIENGWTARPELWAVNEDGTVKKNGNNARPYNNSLSAGTYSIDDMWAKNENFVYLAFNVTPSDGFAADGMTQDGISHAFHIYVPYTTKVASEKLDEAENVSIVGKRLLSDEEMGLAVNKYWNCQTGTALNGPNATGSVFYATKKFTKEELPVGTVIEVEDGWMYRPEYWVNSAKIGTRPGCSSTYRIVITEDFWDTESERAFNICRIDKTTLSEENWDEVVSAFKIYVPEN